MVIAARPSKCISKDSSSHRGRTYATRGAREPNAPTGAHPLASEDPMHGGSEPLPAGSEPASGAARGPRAQAPVRRRDRPEPPKSERPNSGALAFMAHELRTPLSAIIGMADLLRDSQLTDDQRDMLDIMGRSARALVEIVNGVLDLEKLEAGKLQLERRALSPADCVEECVTLLAASAALKRVDLAYLIEDNVPTLILGDQVRLQQTLINLLGNALKFTESGQVVLTVSGTPGPADQCELRFSVADSGPGVPAEQLGTIFEPYAQAEASTSRRFGGTGLGLPITQRIVALMGGRLWLDSQIGRGSTFHFTLPAAIPPDIGVRARQEPADLAGRRVLIVEDNPVVGRLIVATLERWKIEATLVHDLTHAVSALREGAFHAALIDGELPGLSGHSVALALRSIPGQSALPLILMTDLGSHPVDRERRAEGPGARFAAYVTKPLRPARLHDALAQALANGPSDVPPSPATTPLRRLSGIRVLVADDDAGVREVLSRSLSSAGAEVRTVPDGARVLNEAYAWAPDTILLDASMPGIGGFEVCRLLKADPRTRLIPVIIITGLDTVDDRRSVAEAGADGFIAKPFAREELFVRVRSSAHTKQATDSLERADEELVVMARSIEARDPNTLGHCERLADYCARLGARIGMTESEILALRISGIVHDIGKATLPAAILQKPAALDDAEWAAMRAHPVEGERLCSGAPTLSPVLPIIRHHHEKMDGSGYPDGLAGNAIPRAARVLQIVDVYDALTTARRYRWAESPEGALGIIEKEVQRGWWDPIIFSAFRELVREDLHARRGRGAPRH
jgi:response regulator RpfG family c-di-GMP phosphodiesterase